MSDEPATAERTRGPAAVRRAIGALGVVACFAITAAAIVAPSPAIVLVLCACAIVTGVLLAGSVPRPVPGLRWRRRLAPIRPSARRALAEFRRELDALPETAHPIGR
jgi:hypothetical protein